MSDPWSKKWGVLYTAYVWGYNDTYPVIIAENANLSDLDAAFNSSNLENLLNNIIGDMTTEPQKTAWRNFNIALRSNSGLTNALVTTYTYIPLVGMTSSTDPAGITTYYEYDAFNRLSLIRDSDGNIIKKIDYHYAN